MNWKNETRKIADLKPAAYNPRKISKKQKEDLNDSLTKFDVVDPIVINANGTIIGGHQRFHILKEKGIEEVDVRVPERELSIEEEKELNLRLNKNVGEFDWSILQDFDADMLLNVGFTDEEMKMNFGLHDSESTEVDPDRAKVIMVEMPEAPRIRSRSCFYCDTPEQFQKIKEKFGTNKEGHLDLTKLLKLIQGV